MEKNTKDSQGKTNDSVVTVDAVHPRFLKKSESEKLKKIAICEECDGEVDSSTNALRNHFLSYRHRSISRCVYCQGPVYKYTYRNIEGTQYFHECSNNLLYERNYECSAAGMQNNDSGISENLNISSAQNNSETSSFLNSDTSSILSVEDTGSTDSSNEERVNEIEINSI